MNIEPQPRDQESLDLAFLSPATPDEIAAVTAVLTAALEEHANEARRTTAAPRSAWEASRRQLRKPITPGPGAWRGFSV